MERMEKESRKQGRMELLKEKFHFIVLLSGEKNKNN